MGANRIAHSMNRALYVLIRDVPLGVILIGGLWASVHFMISALALFDPSRVPQ